ncbi:MAG: lipid-binding SYLF domain-containing protein [Bryobacterales bacterium]|nr:lipid-binding SYLF domain-containing protein [Bryobacterales bacterium]
MRMRVAAIGLVALGLLTAQLVARDDEADRVRAANEVVRDMMAAGDKGIPQDLMDHATCIVVIPGMKRAAFVIGGSYGAGIASCRDSRGWSAPSAVKMEGGSIGFQIGAGEVDLILVVLNEKGKQRLFESKFTLGGEAAVMAGPVGRQSSAETDAFMTAEILTYSQSRGIYAGIDVKGSTLRPNDDENRELYGREVSSRDILEGRVPAPTVTKPFLATLNKYSPYQAGHASKR